MALMFSGRFMYRHTRRDMVSANLACGRFYQRPPEEQNFRRRNLLQSPDAQPIITNYNLLCSCCMPIG